MHLMSGENNYSISIESVLIEKNDVEMGQTGYGMDGCVGGEEWISAPQ